MRSHLRRMILSEPKVLGRATRTVFQGGGPRESDMCAACYKRTTVQIYHTIDNAAWAHHVISIYKRFSMYS